MICIIRISGDVKIREDTRETFRRLGLTRKYSCIVLDKPTPVELGMIKEIKDFIAFGELDAETYKKLVEARGKKFKEKKNVKFKKEMRMVFRLHPPRGGINTKQHYSLENGNVKRLVLGNHGKKINELLEKML
ncbi:50S ribosomal protein L30 [uncultured archaeon]|nr:50S ribosomal protein L30 [uncultured archaeon]